MNNLQPVHHTWSFITDLPSDWRTTLANPETTALVQAWQQQAGELREKDLYKAFLAKLRREWAIETGVIEGAYDLSEGATKTLIEKGLDASLISHGDTSGSPDRVFATIRDHHQAILGLYQFISGQRQLGISYIKELHQALMAHQERYAARDTLGNLVERDLPRGQWKTLPNNVEHVDGTAFEYCPPEHVAQEMEHLVAFHLQHTRDGVPPDIEAAWLHHRFTLIHPFTDGNGRVARCLATLVFLKAEWLPLVITRNDREPYISAIREADRGSLKPLVDFFGNLQREAIRTALSLADEMLAEETFDASTAIQGVLDSAQAKLKQQTAAPPPEIAQAFRIAESLVQILASRLHDVANQVHDTLSAANTGYNAHMYFPPRHSPEVERYCYHISEWGKRWDYFANLSAYQAWAVLVIEAEGKTEFLFSFHGIGRGATGVLGCAAMAYTKGWTEAGENAIGDVVSLTNSPFGFTYLDEPDEVQKRFRDWLDRCIVCGLHNWQNTL
jgi:Fic family protein